jgi:hypothetical protein
MFQFSSVLFTILLQDTVLRDPLLPCTTGENTGNVDSRFICVSKKVTLSCAALLVPVDTRTSALVLGNQASSSLLGTIFRFASGSRDIVRSRRQRLLSPFFIFLKLSTNKQHSLSHFRPIWSFWAESFLACPHPTAGFSVFSAFLVPNKLETSVSEVYTKCR